MQNKPTSCAYCNRNSNHKCSSCGKYLCPAHVIHDDPYHSTGLFYKPRDYCKACFKKKQGPKSMIIVLVAMILLSIFIMYMIFNLRG